MKKNIFLVIFCAAFASVYAQETVVAPEVVPEPVAVAEPEPVSEPRLEDVPDSVMALPATPPAPVETDNYPSLPAAPEPVAAPEPIVVPYVAGATPAVLLDPNPDPMVEKPALHWGFPLLMGFIQNVVLWQYNLQIADEEWARISPRTIRDNFKKGFVWDDNHFGVNYFGHPYQGSWYFVAGRSAGYSFYPSLLYTAIGSFTWECCMESEWPSTNDFVVTSLGGAVYGEILYRLSERLLAKPKPSLADEASAFVLHPMGYGQRKVVGVRQNNPGYHPIDLSIGLGGGSRMAGHYNYDREIYTDPNIDNWDGGIVATSLNLVYGKPNRTMKAPFEYFTVDAFFNYGDDGAFFKMNTVGKLKNMAINNEDGWVDVGTYVHFDTYYGDFMEMNALSLGLGLDFNLQGSHLRFRTTQLPSIMVMGATDFNYDEVFKERFGEEHGVAARKRHYQYSYGPNYKLNTEIEWLNRGIIKNNASAYLFRPVPSSKSHYGVDATDFVLSNSALMEIYLPWSLKIGGRFDTYVKVATFDKKEFSLMSRIVNTAVGYLAYSI